MKRVLTIFGTRPEFIKLAPVILELQKFNDVEAMSLFTGQHEFEFLGFNDFPNLEPPRILALERQPEWGLARLNSELIQSIAGSIEEIRPDIVVVHGDTATTLSGAMAAFFSKIPVLHVEAGLRTGNLYEPFPEEFNRQVVARIATMNFAPTAGAAENLRREGVPENKIQVTGNTVVDSLTLLNERFRTDQSFNSKTKESLVSKGIDSIDQHDLVLVTTHRRENQGSNFEEICSAIALAADRFPEAMFVFATHPNKELQQRAKKVLFGRQNVPITPPLTYSELVYLLCQARLVVTDSGGIQEEGVSLGKHVLVTRNITERPEGLATGLLHVIGSDRTAIVSEIEKRLIADTVTPSQQNPYGDGFASRRIAKTVADLLRNEN